MEGLKNSVVSLNRRVDELEKEMRMSKRDDNKDKIKKVVEDRMIEPIVLPIVVPNAEEPFIPPISKKPKKDYVIPPVKPKERLSDPHQDQIEQLIKELQDKADEVLLTAQELKELDNDDDLESLASVATDVAIEQLETIDTGLTDDNPDIIKIHHDCGNCSKQKLKLHKKLQKDKKIAEKGKKKRTKQNNLKIIEEEQSQLALKLHRLKLT